MKFNKISPKTIVLALAIGAVIFMILTQPKSTYTTEQGFPIGATAEKKSAEGAPTKCEMKAGTGLASSLLPKEVASQEDFGEFAPEDVLAGQNFLEPRAQIGFPETVGGALRNANQQVRAVPPNSKEPFVWNNSTIAPDTMRRPLC